MRLDAGARRRNRARTGAIAVFADASFGLNVFFLIVAMLGVVATIAIFWFGLRSARRHDEEHGP